MKSITKLLAYASLFLFGTFASINAAPAHPFPIKVKQPDGETITIRLHGDEFFHYTTSDDMYVIVQDESGYYNYAIINDKNVLASSGIKVSGSLLKSSKVVGNLVKADSPEFREKIKEPALTNVLEKRIKEFAGNQNALRSSGQSAAITGNAKGLIILANYKDVKFTVNQPQQAFTNMLNQAGYSENGATGSARDFFIDNSNGAYMPDFEVFGPVDLPQNMEYYGKNTTATGGSDQNVPQMILDACNATNQKYNINFADYDNDKDGVLDFVFVFYAGYSESQSGNGDEVWPQKYTLYNEQNPIKIDGTTLSSYACTSERKLIGGVDKGIAGIGLFTHEFGHVLGLPDLYDADGQINGKGVGVGEWSVMGYGLDLNEGRTPPYYGAVERWMLGWITPPPYLNPLDVARTVNLPVFPSSGNAYFLKTPTPDEFFSFEVRKKEGWDTYLPGEGMLVYHVDMTKNKDKQISFNGQTYTTSAQELWGIGLTNIIGNHQCMDLLRANNDPNDEKANGNPFPGAGNKTSLSDDTSPNLISWNNEKSGAKFTNIVKNPDGSVSFDLIKSGNTGIDENKTDLPLAYATGKTVYFKNIKANTSVSLYDVNGALIFSKTISGNFNQELAYTGQFIAKITCTNQQQFTYKLLIK